MKYYVIDNNIHVFETDPNKGSLVTRSMGKLTTVGNTEHPWFKERPWFNPTCKINMSFFNSNGSRNGASYEDGMWSGTPRDNDNWIEAIWLDNKLIIDDMQTIDYATKYKGASWIKGVCPLLYNGKIDLRKSQVAATKNPRTFFGQRKDGTIVMVVTDGRPYGLTFQQSVDLAVTLDLYNAVMFDSGGSSTMCINNKMVNDNENRSVVDALIFYSKEKLEEVKVKKIVVLDAGHGMYTTGKETPPYADGSKIKEAEQNYPIMFKLAEYLEYQGIEVVITNKDIEYDMSLSKRVDVEKYSEADLFVSIHKNASPTFDWNDIEGIETYCYKFGYEGEKAARAVHAELVKTLDKDRGVKEGNFYVIRETEAPAILCEIGFMTNLKEANRMLDVEWHNVYAEKIARGICNYFGIVYKEEVEDNSVRTKVLEDLVEIDKLNDTIKAAISEIDTLITSIQSHLE